MCQFGRGAGAIGRFLDKLDVELRKGGYCVFAIDLLVPAQSEEVLIVQVVKCFETSNSKVVETWDVDLVFNRSRAGGERVITGGMTGSGPGGGMRAMDRARVSTRV